MSLLNVFCLVYVDDVTEGCVVVQLLVHGCGVLKFIFPALVILFFMGINLLFSGILLLYIYIYIYIYI